MTVHRKCKGILNVHQLASVIYLAHSTPRRKLFPAMTPVPCYYRSPPFFEAISLTRQPPNLQVVFPNFTTSESLRFSITGVFTKRPIQSLDSAHPSDMCIFLHHRTPTSKLHQDGQRFHFPCFDSLPECSIPSAPLLCVNHRVFFFVVYILVLLFHYTIYLS